MADHSQLICSKCQEVLLASEYITCEQCSGKFHCNCVGLNEELRKTLKAIQGEFSWSCGTCKLPRNKPSSNRVSDASATNHLQTAQLLPNQAALSEMPEMDSATQEIPNGESNTRVNIRSAKTVNNYHNYMLTPQNAPNLLQLPAIPHSCKCQEACNSCEEYSGTHSETHGAINKRIDSRKATREECDKVLLEKICRLQDKYKKDENLMKYSDNIKDILSSNTEKSIDDDSLISKLNCKLKELFLKDRIGKPRKRNILLTKESGFGKGYSLISKIAFDWATLPNPMYLDVFDVVVVIPLNKLEYMTIHDAVLGEMCGGNDRETLLQALEEKHLKFLLILDGYEKARNKNEIWNFLKANDNDFLWNATVVLATCGEINPSSCNPFSWNNMFNDFDSYMYVNQFILK